MRVSDYIASKIVELGITHVFCVTGGGAMHLNDSLAHQPGLKMVFNHHEQACAIAAEGYYRASGKIACVNVTTGPGGLNTLTGVMGQWTDSIPVIYISGQVKFETTIAAYPYLSIRQIGDQEVDIISIVRPLTKYAVQLRSPDDVQYELEKAFSIATSGRMGPVWIDVPMNIQGAVFDGSRQRKFHPENLEFPIDLEQIKYVAEKLLSAQCPLIVAGHGIRLSRGGIEAFHKLLEIYPVPVVTTFNGFDLVENSHPLYIGRIGTIGTRAGNFALQNADVVLFLGTRNNIRQVSYNWKDFAKKAFKIIVDIDNEELKKPTIRPDIPVRADIRHFCTSLIDNLLQKPKIDCSSWVNWCKRRQEKYPVVLPEYQNKIDGVHPYYFIKELTHSIPENMTIIAGNGTACVALFQAGEVKKGSRYFWNSGCASMGYDLPAALGAAVALNDQPIICIAGDGSMQMNIQELATISQLNLPIKIFYFNNDGYNSIKQTHDSFFGRRTGCDTLSGLKMPNIKGIAQGYGLPYYNIKSDAEIKKVINATLSEKRPNIIEVFLTQDYIFAPKVSSLRLQDGSMISKPLDDMYPFLAEEEYKLNFYKI